MNPNQITTDIDKTSLGFGNNVVWHVCMFNKHTCHTSNGEWHKARLQQKLFGVKPVDLKLWKNSICGIKIYGIKSCTNWMFLDLHWFDVPDKVDITNKNIFYRYVILQYMYYMLWILYIRITKYIFLKLINRLIVIVSLPGGVI